MNLHHLRIFCAVADERSISRASERLMISQPAVSKQIKLLEESLGATLFDRHARGARLTPAGEVLAGYARRIAAMESEAEEAMRDVGAMRRGRLAIGASTTLGIYVLPERFVAFCRRYPGIQATLDISSSKTIESRLLEGVFDLGFIEVTPDDVNIVATEFMADELVAIVSPKHRLARSRRVRPSTFCQEPFIVRATGSDTRSYVERALAQRGLTVKPVMSLASTEAIKRAVAAGIGVAIVSRLSVELELKAKALRVIRLEGLSIKRPLYQITRRGHLLSAAAKAFVSDIEAE